MNKNMPVIVFFAIIFFVVLFFALSTQKITGPDIVLNPTIGPSPTNALTLNEKPSATPAPQPTFAPVAQLKIEDLKPGMGAEVASASSVTVNYIGRLTNGQIFDTSLTQGRQPLTFQVGTGQVIRGWEEGLLGMKVGGQRRLHIPPSLGYGAQGAGGTIPPNATLIFDIELLNVQ